MHDAEFIAPFTSSFIVVLSLVKAILTLPSRRQSCVNHAYFY